MSAEVNDTGVMIMASKVYLNTAVGHGGGLYYDDFAQKTTSALSVCQGSNIYDNTAEADGGGIYIRGGQADISESVLNNNISDRFGGGIFVNAGAVANIEGVAITNNFASQRGGGIYVVADAYVSLDMYTFLLGNEAGEYDGGAYEDGAIVINLAGGQDIELVS